MEMRRKIFKRLAMLGCIVYACLLNAQTTPTSNPLFSLEGVKDVVSMYTDETAQTFYLHTDKILYTVSREGNVLSSDSSKVKWACWDNGVMYTHEKGENYILDGKKDTVLYLSDSDLDLSSRLRDSQILFHKNGAFYWWYGGVNNIIGRSDALYVATEGKVEQMKYFPFPCKGIALLDQDVFLHTYTYSACYGDAGLFSFFSLDSIRNDNPLTLPLGIDSPVGLSLVGDTFYIWSNETQTMYWIPQSCFDNIIAGIRTASIERGESISFLYDLTGRPADGTQKGIFIKNGKKIVVR